MRSSKVLWVILAIAACGASGAALADNPLNPLNPLGFYVGAGVGESQNRSDHSRYGYPGYFNDTQFAWQAMVGIRPIHLLGIEAEYIDFGQPYRHNGFNDANFYGTDSHPRAPVLFGVGYLPIPVPFLDVFAKAGAAWLETNVSDFVQTNCTVAPCPYVPFSRHTVTNTKFAYGAGVQSKFPFGLIVRGEYERISSSFGDPDAFMVSALWQF